MGSSALAAELCKVWPSTLVPFEVLQDYDLPAYVSGDTYFIAASYSGDSAEVLSALKQAQARGATIAVVTSGGQLARIARENGYPLMLLPAGASSQRAFFYAFKALVCLLDQAGLVALQGAVDELPAAGAFVGTQLDSWLPAVATAKNPAKQLALEIIGKSVVIYSGPLLAPAAHSFKADINQNAKHIAWTGQYPGHGQTELLGWTKQPVIKPYAVIELRSNFDNPQVIRHMDASKRVLSGLRPSPHIITAQGDTILAQLLWSMAFGNFVSLYLALANGLNPSKNSIITKLKETTQL